MEAAFFFRQTHLRAGRRSEGRIAGIEIRRRVAGLVPRRAHDARPGAHRERRGEARAAHIFDRAVHIDDRTRIGIGIHRHIRDRAEGRRHVRIVGRHDGILPIGRALELAGATAAGIPRNFALIGTVRIAQKRGAADAHDVSRCCGIADKGRARRCAIGRADRAERPRVACRREQGLALCRAFEEDLVVGHHRAVEIREEFADREGRIGDLREIVRHPAVELERGILIAQRGRVVDVKVLRIAGHAGRILRVEIPFVLTARIGTPDADMLDGHRHLGEAHGLLEGPQVGHDAGHIAFGHHRDGRIRGSGDRVHIVGQRIGRRVVACAHAGGRRHGAGRDGRCRRSDIVETQHRQRDALQRGGDLRGLCVDEHRCAVLLERGKACVERRRHLGCGSHCTDEHAIRCDRDRAEARFLQIVGDHIGGGGARRIDLGELLGCEVFAERGRSWCVLRLDEVLQRRCVLHRKRHGDAHRRRRIEGTERNGIDQGNRLGRGVDPRCRGRIRGSQRCEACERKHCARKSAGAHIKRHKNIPRLG